MTDNVTPHENAKQDVAVTTDKEIFPQKGFVVSEYEGVHSRYNTCDHLVTLGITSTPKGVGIFPWNLTLQLAQFVNAKQEVTMTTKKDPFELPPKPMPSKPITQMSFEERNDYYDDLEYWQDTMKGKIGGLTIQIAQAKKDGDAQLAEKLSLHRKEITQTLSCGHRSDKKKPNTDNSPS